MVKMEIQDIINSDKNKCNAYRNLPPLFVVTLGGGIFGGTGGGQVQVVVSGWLALAWAMARAWALGGDDAPILRFPKSQNRWWWSRKRCGGSW